MRGLGFRLCLVCKSAATRAKTRVNTTHSAMTVKFGISPKEKWETAPVRAVNVIIKTHVPTAVLSSYPSTEVRISSIIIPPPAPTNPHIKPTRLPAGNRADNTPLFAHGLHLLFVVMTGFTINFMPSSSVMKTEKFPMVAEGTTLETKLPTTVKTSTAAIIIRPFFMSRFLFFL